MEERRQAFEKWMSEYGEDLWLRDDLTPREKMWCTWRDAWNRCTMEEAMKYVVRAVEHGIERQGFEVVVSAAPPEGAA